MAVARKSGERTNPFARIKLTLEWLSKKTIYIIICMALMIFLTLSFITDFTALLITENVQNTTQNFTFTIFLLHSILFYLTLMAFVFSSKYGGRKSLQAWLSLILLLGNTALFLLRILLEVIYVGYRAEQYTLNDGE